MTLQYDENGLIIQNLTEILNERENNLRPIFGEDFIISGESAVGNLQASDADRELSLQELLLYISSQLDPDQAEGLWLDYICALNNIVRFPATKSSIPITVKGTAGTTKNIGEIVIVDNNTDEYYANKTAIVLNASGEADVMFEATSFGPITALSSSDFYIKTPSLGISSVEYNTSGTPIIGRNTETDEELRLRRASSVSYTASSILNSIKVAVEQVSDVESVSAYENVTMSTVDGIPAKSFEIVALGGNNEDIARAILSKKPAGIQAYGTTTVTIEDDDYNVFTIGFTRPTEVSIDMQITFVSDEVQSDDWKTNLKNEIVQEFSKKTKVGSSVYVYNLYCVLNQHPEIKNVTLFQVKEHEDTTWDDSVTIQKRELARLSIDNITITQSA